MVNRQIRYSIIYPQRMGLHKHAKLLETIVHHVQQSKDKIYIYQVKTHAGILGHKYTDAIAKCSARMNPGHMPCRSHSHWSPSPFIFFFWPARVLERSAALLPEILNTCQLLLSAEIFFIFSDLDAVKVFVCVRSLSKKNLKPSVHKMPCKNNKNWSREALLRKT